MPIINQLFDLETNPGIGIYNITPLIQKIIHLTTIKNGQVFVFSRHTTTALAINEYEERLLEDIKVYLNKLASEGERYLHNDLHLTDVPDDEMSRSMLTEKGDNPRAPIDGFNTLEIG